MRPGITALAAALCAAALAAGCAGTQPPVRPATPAASPATRPSTAAAPVPAAPYIATGRKYAGLASPAGPPGLAAFQSLTGTRPDLYETYVDWNQPYPAAQIAAARTDGALTVVSWQPTDTTLAAIAAGRQDPVIEAFAAAAHASGLPVIISFAHEFNGDWTPWGTSKATPAQFVAAWRRIHDIFTRAGDVNVLWAWSPNVVNPVPGVALKAYWPGAAYVDIVGISGYWTGQLGEDSYPGLFGPTERAVGAFAHKAFLIVETGAQPGPHKAAWIADLIDGARADPSSLGFVYFDFGTAQGKRADWTIDHDPAALTAWRTAMTRYEPYQLPPPTATPPTSPSAAALPHEGP